MSLRFASTTIGIARSFSALASLALLSVTVGLSSVGTARAEDAAIAETPASLHEEIDRLILAGTPDYAKIAAPRSSDSEFLRRVTLDLNGTLPTIAETRAFLADADPNKRAKAIDRLLANAFYARHMQRTFDVMLMRRLPAKNVAAAEWETFLRTSFAENKGWNGIVREILAADGTDPKQRGPARFALDRAGDANDLTRDVARIFLGANIECAQCHDHPTIDDYRQSHYYGIQAFYIRSFLFTDEKKVAMLAEKGEGEVTFESVFEVRDKTSKGPKSSPPLIFEQASFTEPKFEKGQEYLVAPDPKKKEVRPIPKFSRRSYLPDTLTSKENRRFARNGANRVWAMLLGRGLVHPVDQDHSQNPPSHPDLLDQLTDEFVRSGFDLRHLIREIALSETYQLASQHPSATAGSGALPAESAFAVALLKPLSPAQFAWSVCEAVGETEIQRASLGAKLTEATLHARLASYENQFVSMFGGSPGQPVEALEPTIDQSLWLANNANVLNLLSQRAGNLADRALKLPTDNPGAIAEELFLSIFARLPTAEESEDVANYLKDTASDVRFHAMKDLIWALIMSSEFRVVH